MYKNNQINSLLAEVFVQKIVAKYENLFADPDNFANYDLQEEAIEVLKAVVKASKLLDEDAWTTPELFSALESAPNLSRELLIHLAAEIVD